MYVAGQHSDQPAVNHQRGSCVGPPGCRRLKPPAAAPVSALADFASGTRSRCLSHSAYPDCLFYGDPGVPHGYYHGKWNRLRAPLRQSPSIRSRARAERVFARPTRLGYQEPPLYYQLPLRRPCRRGATPLRWYASPGRPHVTPYATLSRRQPLPQAVSANGQQCVLPHIRFLLRGSYEFETVLFAELEFERSKSSS